MTAADRGPQGRQRAEAYWYLAALFAARPEGDLLARMAGLAHQAGDAESGVAGQLLAALQGEADLDGLGARLAVEHARLFRGIRVGYGPPPPFESLWREGRLMGDTTADVARCYLEANYEHDAQWGPLDHLVEELRFMAALCNAEDEAWRTGCGDEAQWARERQQGFLEAHLLAWLPAYCQTLADEAREPLYQALARVTAEVLAQDAQHLRDVAGTA
jgi:TorA maturation chaperone TorD